MPEETTLNLPLIRYLKRQEHPVIPSDIEDKLGLDHNDLISELEALADAGYEIELHPYLGVRLLDIPDRLLKHEILESLNTKVIGKKMHIFETCGSTSEELWKLVEAGNRNDGELALAEYQSEGRGRMGRGWESARGKGLYLSFVAKQKMPPDRLVYVTCAATLAVVNMIEQFAHLPATIKWPNDVYIGGRKVAGILVEARNTAENICVVGIGININQREDDFPEALRPVATSLRIERKSGQINRVRLLRPLLFYLDTLFAQLRKKKYDRIERAWREYVMGVGKQVMLVAGSVEHKGTLVEIDLEKGIKLKEGGKEKTFRAEHVQTISEMR